ncbi:hypothetical protein C8034_v006291 [Colletotrichum sidae]|uniref:Uncharacterized protein n=1 Tax=Colletotrichum sidae TaxID=1347389 RepID=A0A4V3I5C3_9PEZI|nr:hypothetical protein C8034_v006291 [Colletotrichum sidae]
MPPLSEPAEWQRFQQLPNTRRFLRRGAVTGLVDPMAGHARLQGVPADWPPEPPHPPPPPPPEPPLRASFPPPAPLQPLRDHDPPAQILIVPRPPQQPRFRFVTARSALWLAVASTILVVASWLIFNLWWSNVSFLWRRGTDPNSATSGSWREASASSGKVATLLVRSVLISYGGHRLLKRGLASMVDFFPPTSYPRAIRDNRAAVSFNLLAIVAVALYPTAVSLAFATTVPEGFCDAKNNVHRFIPPRTRDDIKSILDGWFAVFMAHFKTGTSLQQLHRWQLTVGRGLVWVLAVAAWSVVEIGMGPCWYYSRVWSFWYAVLSMCFASWFVGRAEQLIVAKRELLCVAHLELVMFLAVLYIVKWVKLEGFCEEPGCW